MLARYVTASGDQTILNRALPLAEVWCDIFCILLRLLTVYWVQKELKWWNDNRSVNITSPFSNKTRTMYHFSVTNSAPRPESYLTGTSKRYSIFAFVVISPQITWRQMDLISRLRWMTLKKLHCMPSLPVAQSPVCMCSTTSTPRVSFNLHNRLGLYCSLVPPNLGWK